MKWIDIPPVWLACFAALAWVQSTVFTLGLSLASGVSYFLGGILIGAGLILIVLAAMEFRKHKTTIVPHQMPDRIIQSGVFSKTRNPIYLGDALILAGLCLRWDAVLSLVLVPVFVWIIERRFIIPEENRMRRQFRSDYARYEQKVRRWV
jgi:protein-S-isoprenylcysteine O-methyltransferase Ste14